MDGSSDTTVLSGRERRAADPARGGVLMRFIRARRGDVAIEFALGLPIFLAMIYGVFEFGRIFWTQNTMEFAVEEAARFTMVNPNATNGQITAIVEGKAAGLDTSRIEVDIVFEAETSGTIGSRGFVNITGTYKYFPIIPLVIPFSGSGTLDFTKFEMEIITSTRMPLVIQ